MKAFKRFIQAVLVPLRARFGKKPSPEQLLTAFIEEMNGQLTSLRDALQGTLVEQKKLEAQLEELRRVDSDDRLRTEQQVAALEKKLLSYQEETKLLKNALFTAKRRTDDARRSYQLVVSKYQAAKSTSKIAEVVGSTGKGSALEMIEKLEGQIFELEADADARFRVKQMIDEEDFS